MKQTFTALLSSVMRNESFDLISLRRTTEAYILVFTLLDDDLRKLKGTRTLYDISLYTDVNDLLDELWYTEKLLYIR